MLTADSQSVCRQLARVAVSFLKAFDAEGYAKFKSVKFPGGAPATTETKQEAYEFAMNLFAGHVAKAATTYSQVAHDEAMLLADAFNADSFKDKEGDEEN